MSTNARKISVVGLGWLGLPLASKLKEAGYEVIGSSTRAERLPILRETGIEASVFRLHPDVNQGEFEKILDADTLILNIPPGRKKADQGKSYLQGIQQLAIALPKSPLQSLIFVSSTRVYESSIGPVDEDSFLQPQSPYAQHLLQAEQTLQKGILPTTVLRLAGLVGGKRHPIKYLQGKEGLQGGELPTNLIHRDDVIGLIEAILKQEAWDRVFLGVAGQKPQKRNYYPEIARRLGLTPPVYRSGESKEFPLISNEKTLKTLGYMLKYEDPLEMPFDFDS